MAQPNRRSRTASRTGGRVTLDEALRVVVRLPTTADLDLRQTVAVRTVCEHLADAWTDAQGDDPNRPAAPA